MKPSGKCQAYGWVQPLRPRLLGVVLGLAGWPVAARAANVEEVSYVAVVAVIALVFALGMVVLAVQLNVWTASRRHRGGRRGSHMNFFQRHRQSVIAGAWLAMWLGVLAAIFYAAHR